MKIFLILILGLFGSAIAMAQLPTATILGTVKDPSGAFVANAKVTVRNTDTNDARTVFAGTDGNYRVPALPVGNYSVHVDAPSFKGDVGNGIVLTVGQEQVLDFTLQLGAASETVDVTADLPIMNTTSGSLGGTVDEKKMQELPLNGRNYIQLSLLQAGISEDRAHTQSSNALAGAGVWFSSNGAPARANGYLLDGTSLSTYGGGSGSSIGNNTLGLDGIREFRVVTNNFSADFGMVMGSQMTMVSKSGTNQYHGDLFYSLRNSALDARNYFDSPFGAGHTVAGAQRRIPPFRRNNFGAALGGYVVPDKTFFFLTYEGLRQDQGVSFKNTTLGANCRGTAGTVIWNGQGAQPVGSIGPCTQLGNNPQGAAPTPPSNFVTLDARTAPWTNLFPLPNGANGTDLSWSFQQPNNEDFGQGRVDQTFSTKDNAFVRYTIDSDNIGIPNTYPGSDYLGTSFNYFITAAENHTFSPSLLNTARYSFSHTTSTIGVKTYVSGPQFSYEPGIPMGTLGVGGLTSAMFGGNPTSQAMQNIFAYSDDLFITKGKHSIKTGFLFNHYQVFAANGVSLWGQIKFASVANFLKTMATPSTYQAIAPGGINYKDVRYDTIAGYVQDDFKAGQKLTLNMGIRYEINTDIKVVGPSLAFNGAIMNPDIDVNFTPTDLLTKNPSYSNVAPRLGFAYDLFGNGKTAIRGGFGENYQVAAWTSFLHGSTRAPFGQNQFTGNSNAFTIPLNVPTGNSLATLQARNPTIYDWNIKQPKMLQYNLAIQQQLPWGVAITAAYSGSRGYNLQVLSDGNPTVPNGTPVLVNGTYVCRYAGSSATPPIAQQNLIYGPGANACVAPIVATADGTYYTTPQTTVANRLNNNWGPFNEIQDSRDSWYNALQIEVQKSLWHGLQFQSNFTYSKMLDNTQGASSGVTEVNGSSTYASDPWNANVDRGPSSLNMPINSKTNIIYHLPKIGTSNRIVSGFVNGWWMTGILQFQAGLPFTVTYSGSRSGLNVDGSNVAIVDRPMIVSGRHPHDITHGTSACQAGSPQVATTPTLAGHKLGTPDLWFDPCAFSIQSSGFLGNEGRNILQGPTYNNVDFSLVKDTRLPFLGQGGNLEFRAEIFDLLNHPNFALPTNTSFAGTGSTVNDTGEAVVSGAGTIATTANPLQGSRQIQLAVKVIF